MLTDRSEGGRRSRDLRARRRKIVSTHPVRHPGAIAPVAHRPVHDVFIRSEIGREPDSDSSPDLGLGSRLGPEKAGAGGQARPERFETVIRSSARATDMSLGGRGRLAGSIEASHARFAFHERDHESEQDDGSWLRALKVC